MLTAALYLVLALAVGGVLFFLSVAVFGGSTPQPVQPAPAGAGELARAPERSDLVAVTADTIPLALPEGRAMSATDVDALRLPVALRGYRMAETDEALDRLARELTERDEQIEALRAEVARQAREDAEADDDDNDQSANDESAVDEDDEGDGHAESEPDTPSAPEPGRGASS